MSAVAPDPLVPAEVDLQDFAFMPLHVARLRDSDLAAEEDPEACWYAVLLWAASWHQIPAGSLPDNDTVLMRLVGLGRDTRTWKKHRLAALRGFVLCSDGRLYHPVVAETALESWNGKLRARHQKFCAAVRQHNKRNPDNILQSPTFDEWETAGRPQNVTETVTDASREQGGSVTRDSATKGEGEGEGEGQGDSIEEPDGSSPPSPHRDPDWIEIPDWIPAEPWNAWLAMRKGGQGRKRCWPTARAVELSIGKLDELRAAGHPPGRVLDQSTSNNWTGLFPLKDNQNGSGNHAPRDNRDGYTRAIDRRLGAESDERAARSSG